MDLTEKFPVEINIDLVDTVFTIMHNYKSTNKKSISEALPLNKKLKVYEIEAIIKMLEKEDLIFLFDSGSYVLSVKGHIFWEEGGYRQKEKSIRVTQRYQRIQTLILIGGTGAAGVYGIFEILKWLFHHEHWRILF